MAADSGPRGWAATPAARTAAARTATRGASDRAIGHHHSFRGIVPPCNPAQRFSWADVTLGYSRGGALRHPGFRVAGDERAGAGGGTRGGAAERRAAHLAQVSCNRPPADVRWRNILRRRTGQVRVSLIR